MQPDDARQSAEGGWSWRTQGAGGTHCAHYHGYRYRRLTSQGPHAPRGKYDYVVNGKLFGGFAVIAWLLRDESTGIKSFMVSHDGPVFERDLGPSNAARAAAIKSFDSGPVQVTP